MVEMANGESFGMSITSKSSFRTVFAPNRNQPVFCKQFQDYLVVEKLGNLFGTHEEPWFRGPSLRCWPRPDRYIAYIIQGDRGQQDSGPPLLHFGLGFKVPLFQVSSVAIIYDRTNLDLNLSEPLPGEAGSFNRPSKHFIILDHQFRGQYIINYSPK